MKELIRIDLQAPAIYFKPAPDATAPQPKKPQYLTLLPAELLIKVFDHLSNDDCVFLAVTSRHCWEVGAGLVQRRYLVDEGCSAGDRVMLVGEYQKVDDLPARLLLGLTPEERLELAGGPADACADTAPAAVGPSGARAETTFVKTLYSFANESYRMSLWEYDGTLQERVMYRHHNRCSADAAEPTFDMHAILNRLLPRTIYAQSDLVLRNLSRREYVRGEEVTALRRTVSVCRRATLGHVMLAQVSWGSNARSVRHGAWARDRCDIMTKGTHLHELAGAVGWKDVTKKAVSQLWGIYEEQFGRIYDEFDGSKRADITFER